MKKYLPIILITIIALGLRLWNYTTISLWHDEAFSALLIKYSFGEMLYRIGLDVHPPMYYIFLRFWGDFFGDSIASLRGFSVFFGVGTVITTYAFVKQAFDNHRAAVISALLVAVSTFQIQYVSEARMYTMGAFFAVLASYFLVKAIQNKSIPYYGLFAISTSIIIYTHYYLLFTATALLAFGFLYQVFTARMDFKKYALIIGSGIFVALSFVPYLPVFLFQYKQVGGGYWIPPMDRWSIPTTLWQMFIAYPYDIQKTIWMVLIVGVTALSLYVIFHLVATEKSGFKWMVIMALAAPFGGSVLFALLAHLKGGNSSVYLVRYFLYASTFYSIIIGLWLARINKKAGTILTVLYTLASLYTTAYYWHELHPQTRQGMTAAAHYLEANTQPKDHIFVGTSFEFFNYKYYRNQAIQGTPGIFGSIKPQVTSIPKPLLFSGGRSVEQMLHYEGTAILTNDDLVPDMQKATKPGDNVWIIWTTGFGGKKPDVPGNFVQESEQGYEDIRPYPGTWVLVTKYNVK